MGQKIVQEKEGARIIERRVAKLKTGDKNHIGRKSAGLTIVTESREITKDFYGCPSVYNIHEWWIVA